MFQKMVSPYPKKNKYIFCIHNVSYTSNSFKEDKNSGEPLRRFVAGRIGVCAERGVVNIALGIGSVTRFCDEFCARRIRWGLMMSSFTAHKT